MTTCWYCNSELPETSQYCPSCGHSQLDRTSRPLSVRTVELDHAEHIHKELEQIQIEGLLREMAERLGQAIRDTDTVAFLDVEGPPHFAIVLPETDKEGAALAADKIRRSIATHDFATSGNWRRITVSCGAATIDSDYRPKDEAGMVNRREYTGNLLRESYQALDSGRSAGTNRTTVGAYRS